MVSFFRKKKKEEKKAEEGRDELQQPSGEAEEEEEESQSGPYTEPDVGEALEEEPVPDVESTEIKETPEEREPITETEGPEAQEGLPAPETELTPEPEKKTVFAKFRQGLSRSRQQLGQRLSTLVGRTTADPELWEDLEEALIEADIGVDMTLALLDNLKAVSRKEGITHFEDLRGKLEQLIASQFKTAEGFLNYEAKPLSVLVMGVNGSGKTTTIAKIANAEMKKGRDVILAAADTFRAAASEQLEIWAGRLKAEIVKSVSGADAAAVVFDSIQAASRRNADLVLVDTAGRLHTQDNLMDELSKVSRVAAKAVSEQGSIKRLLIIDGNTGMNGLIQAKAFRDAVGTDGVVITKLDGTAKGGIAVAIAKELDVPIVWVGLGEGMDDLQPFDPDSYARALFEE